MVIGGYVTLIIVNMQIGCHKNNSSKKFDTLKKDWTEAQGLDFWCHSKPISIEALQ